MNEPKLLREVQPVTEDPVREVEKILDQGSRDDKDLLKSYGLYREPGKVKVVEKDENVLKTAANNVYTREELGKLVLRYDMKLLPAKEYKGPVPGSVATEIRKWREAKSKVCPGHVYSHIDPTKLCIFGPRNMFEKTVIAMSDPIAMYPVGNGTYEYVTHWGSDFTWKRRVACALGLVNPFPVTEFGGGNVFVMMFLAAVLCGVFNLIGLIPHLGPFQGMPAFYATCGAYWMMMFGLLYQSRTEGFDKKDEVVEAK